MVKQVASKYLYDRCPAVVGIGAIGSLPVIIEFEHLPIGYATKIIRKRDDVSFDVIVLLSYCHYYVFFIFILCC